MKKIKNILFVSYIKNKGVRRLCFVIGLCLCIWLLFNVIPNISHNAVDKLYNNLEDANTDIYLAHKFETPYWYRKNECMAIYLRKYGLDKNIAYAFNSSVNLLSEKYWCEFYQKECGILKAIKDEPIHLKCSALEGYDHEAIKSLSYIFIFLLVLFYLPFLLICILKLVLKILKWIISGFIESKPKKKGKK